MIQPPPSRLLLLRTTERDLELDFCSPQGDWLSSRFRVLIYRKLSIYRDSVFPFSVETACTGLINRFRTSGAPSITQLLRQIILVILRLLTFPKGESVYVTNWALYRYCPGASVGPSGRLGTDPDCVLK